MHWFGIAGEYNAMVMDLLGQNLEDLYNYCAKNFTLKTILMIIIQMIERLKHVHDNHYIHRDIKPENFLIGKDTTAKTIYLLDFGLAKRYRDEYTHIHIPLKENRNLTGTARYASCNAHNGLEQSRRDDMESIAYVILYFFRKKLPWQGLKCKDKNEKHAKIKEIKMSMTPEKLFEGAEEKEFKRKKEEQEMAVQKALEEKGREFDRQRREKKFNKDAISSSSFAFQEESDEKENNNSYENKALNISKKKEEENSDEKNKEDNAEEKEKEDEDKKIAKKKKKGKGGLKLTKKKNYN